MLLLNPLVQKLLMSTRNFLRSSRKYVPAQNNLKSLLNKKIDVKSNKHGFDQELLLQETTTAIPYDVCNTIKEVAESEKDNLLDYLAPMPTEDYIFPYLSSIDPELTVTVTSYVRTIQIDRPAKKNEMTSDIYEKIENSLREANTDDLTKVVVLTGAKGYFLRGNEYSSVSCATDNIINVTKRKEQLRSFVASFIDFKKPIVALVNGPASGIGVYILGLVDFVYGIDMAQLSTKCCSRGIMPTACASFTFPRIMGYSMASELLYFGTSVTAKSAQAVGLISQLFSSQSFEVETSKRVKALANTPLQELVTIKKLVRGCEKQTLHNVNEDECDNMFKRWQSKDNRKFSNQSFRTNYK